MAKAQYTEEQFKDFGDFYAYTDVFDWHYVTIRELKTKLTENLKKSVKQKEELTTRR